MRSGVWVDMDPGPTGSCRGRLRRCDPVHNRTLVPGHGGAQGETLWGHFGRPRPGLSAPGRGGVSPAAPDGAPTARGRCANPAGGTARAARARRPGVRPRSAARPGTLPWRHYAAPRRHVRDAQVSIRCTPVDGLRLRASVLLTRPPSLLLVVARERGRSARGGRGGRGGRPLAPRGAGPPLRDVRTGGDRRGDGPGDNSDGGD